MSGLLEAGGSRVGEIANNTGMVMADHAEPAVDPRRCELVLSLLAKKWVIPILVELEAEPRRRQYLVTRLKVASSRLDPTIQEMTRWGLVERAWIPCGSTSGKWTCQSACVTGGSIFAAGGLQRIRSLDRVRCNCAEELLLSREMA